MLLLSILYQLVRCLLGLTVVLVRRDLSKDAELLVVSSNPTTGATVTSDLISATVSRTTVTHRASIPCTNPLEWPVPPVRSAISSTQLAFRTSRT